MGKIVLAKLFMGIVLKCNNKKATCKKALAKKRHKKATVQFGQYLLKQDVSLSILGTLG